MSWRWCPLDLSSSSSIINQQGKISITLMLCHRVQVLYKLWNSMYKLKCGWCRIKTRMVIYSIGVEVWPEISLEGVWVGVCNSISWQLVPVSDQINIKIWIRIVLYNYAKSYNTFNISTVKYRKVMMNW